MWFLRFSNSANDYKKRTLQPYPIGYWTVFCYTVENRGGEIRMKKEKAKRYYLTKMLTSYILIVFILLICAFSSFFYFTIRTKTAEIEKSSQKAMEQIGFTAKILYDQVSQVGAGLLSDLSVERFFSLSVSEPVFEYSLYNKMRTLRVSYPFIHSILLYRQESQKLLSDCLLYTSRCV